jgi:hypothetical protein
MTVPCRRRRRSRASPPTHFAQSLTRGQAKIVAIGSSTTAGEGNIKAYPERAV